MHIERGVGKGGNNWKDGGGWVVVATMQSEKKISLEIQLKVKHRSHKVELQKTWIVKYSQLGLVKLKAVSWVRGRGQ